MKTLNESINETQLTKKLDKIEAFINNEKLLDKFEKEVWDPNHDENVSDEDFYTGSTPAQKIKNKKELLEDRQRGCMEVISQIKYFLFEQDPDMKIGELEDNIREYLEDADMDLQSEVQTYIDYVFYDIWKKLFRHTLEDEL